MKQHIERFFQRGSAQLQQNFRKAVLQVNESCKQLNDDFENNNESVVVSDQIKPSGTPSKTVIPSLLRYGYLNVLNKQGRIIDDMKLPLLLPTAADAVFFDVGDDTEKVPNLFQSFIARLLLSIRMDLVKVSIIDMDFGTSFPFVSTITNPVFKCNMIYRQEDVSKFIYDLAKEISDTGRDFLGRFPDMDSYNAQAGDMVHPYHFVFIDDFPNGFVSQSLDGLLRMIDNGNARKTGIKIFINYSEKNPAPRDFDVDRFRKICSCINNKEGLVSFDNWPYRFPQITVPKLELDFSQEAMATADFINGIEQKSLSYSLDSWIEDLKNRNKVWTGSTAEGIRVPIGYISTKKYFEFYMANDKDSSCKDFFALIAGQPGYGKTVLLHNIIVNSAMKYSPDELCLYLADFAEGASFSIYRELPHVKSLMLSNNKEYALRMLEDVVEEAKKRSHLYQKAQRLYGKQVTSLPSYREITGEKLPRILFVMDEFHTLFLSTSSVTIRAKEELCNGIRQWRKFGISVILCTQSISGVSFGNVDTYITYRFALNLLELDSKSVIRNEAAKKLTRKGQTIMNNTSDGRLEANVEFQSAFSPYYMDHVKYLAKLYEERTGKNNVPFICESGTDADIADNKKLVACLTNKNDDKNNIYCDVYVGKPDLLRETHTRIQYRRQLNSNVLVVGDDYRTLVFNFAAQLIQIMKQSSRKSKFFIVDCFNVGDPYFGALNEIGLLSDSFVIGNSQNIGSFIEEMFNELERRKAEQKEGKMTEERMVLAVMNTQNCYELKSTPGRLGTVDQPSASKKLVSLLSEGAPLGIHCLIHTFSYESLFKTTNILSSKEFSYFGNLIFLKNADVYNIMLNGVKVNSPEEVGQMVVVNSKVDGEAYEQCNAYSDVTLDTDSSAVGYLSNLFEKYRYV